ARAGAALRLRRQRAPRRGHRRRRRQPALVAPPRPPARGRLRVGAALLPARPAPDAARARGRGPAARRGARGTDAWTHAGRAAARAPRPDAPARVLAPGATRVRG